ESEARSASRPDIGLFREGRVSLSRCFNSIRRWRHSVSVMAFAIAMPAVAEEKTEFTCLIQPKMVLKLGTPVTGLISEGRVDRGAIVKKGDVVARLDSSVEQAALALAKARTANDSAVRSGRAKLEFQKHKDERTKQLRKNDNIAISTAEEAETAAKVAESELREAEV